MKELFFKCSPCSPMIADTGFNCSWLIEMADPRRQLLSLQMLKSSECLLYLAKHLRWNVFPISDGKLPVSPVLLLHASETLPRILPFGHWESHLISKHNATGASVLTH